MHENFGCSENAGSGCGVRGADCGVRGQQKPKNKFKNNKDNKTTKRKRKTKENSLMHTKIQLKNTREYKK